VLCQKLTGKASTDRAHADAVEQTFNQPMLRTDDDAIRRRLRL
jgi:hypothetical protein